MLDNYSKAKFNEFTCKLENLLILQDFLRRLSFVITTMRKPRETKPTPKPDDKKVYPYMVKRAELRSIRRQKEDGFKNYCSLLHSFINSKLASMLPDE